MLRAGWPDRNDHDPVWRQLLQQRRGDVIDAAGDNDLFKRRILLPAVIAVGVAGLYGAILAVAARDEAVVERSRALRQGGDDLDRPDIRRQVRKIGGLIA